MTAATRQEQLATIFKSATVIPVLTIERLEDAVPLASALVAGGVRVLEVTLRTPVAAGAAQALPPQVASGFATAMSQAMLLPAVALLLGLLAALFLVKPGPVGARHPSAAPAVFAPTEAGAAGSDAVQLRP